MTTQCIHTAVLDNFQAATHSIIKDFVLEPGLTEIQRLARIAVIHAVLDAPEGNLGTYTNALLDILTGGNAKEHYAEAKEAVCAVRSLRVSHQAIISDDFQLNDFGLDLVQHIAEAVTHLMPERFQPMTNCIEAPDHSSFTTLNIEQTAVVKTNLVKNGLGISRKRAPAFFKAMDALWTQQYKLNEDIMSMMNLPQEFMARQFMLGINPAFADTFSYRFTIDSRGRVYARGIIATPQGDGFSKAVLNLGFTKALGEKGLNALCIHYANVSGRDKLSLIKRIEWAKTHGIDLATSMVLADGDFELIKQLSHFEDDKDVFEMYAAAMDFFRAMHTDDPTTYQSSLVCHQDATNSGFQFGAALLGDRATAESTNLLASHYTEAPKDLYKLVAISMLNHLPENLVLTWAPYITRRSVKKVVMVTGYGAGKKTQLKAFGEGLEKIGQGHLVAQMADVQNALSKALEDNASALLKLSTVMKGHAKSTTEEIKWITEDGFMVKHDYQEEESYGSGKYKVVATRFAGTDAGKNASALPPNFIHSIDGNMLRKASIMAREKAIQFVPIHDSFGTHACDFFDLGRLLRAAFIEIMQYDWYHNFCGVNNFEPKLKNNRNFDIYEVRKSTYMFS